MKLTDLPTDDPTAILERGAGLEPWKGLVGKKGSQAGTWESGIVEGRRIPPRAEVEKGIRVRKDNICHDLAKSIALLGCLQGS